MPSNNLEHLRGGVHTLDKLASPSNDCNDNNNRILLQNPIINNPLRLTLRLDNIPPTSEPNTSTEDGIVRPPNEKELQLSPIRENNSSQASNNPFLNNQIIGIGESSVALEMLGSPSNSDPLGLQVSLSSMGITPHVSPDLYQVTSSHAGQIPPRSESLTAVSSIGSNGLLLNDWK